MKVAIVSGVTGQDGALLAHLLLQKNYRVIGLTPGDRISDTFRLEYLSVLEKIQLRKLNLLNSEDVRNLLIEFEPAEFYHLAAISSVGLSFKEPLSTFDFNTRSVLYILEGIRQVSPHTRFYQASSSEMFGNVGVSSLPIKESFLFHPVSPYGISKASAHWLSVNYREAYKLQTCCGILFNHESALRPPNFVIKKIIQTALRIKQGEASSLTLGNLNITRDWGYAPLYVDAMWRMMQAEILDDFLICSGSPISLKEFVSKVFNHLDLDADEYIVTDPSLMRSLDLEIIYGDNYKAKQALGWKYDLTPDNLIANLMNDEVNLMAWQRKKIPAL
jgi:GDPmannose 4,6-dehydratase